MFGSWNIWFPVCFTSSTGQVSPGSLGKCIEGKTIVSCLVCSPEPGSNICCLLVSNFVCLCKQLWHLHRLRDKAFVEHDTSKYQQLISSSLLICQPSHSWSVRDVSWLQVTTANSNIIAVLLSLLQHLLIGIAKLIYMAYYYMIIFINNHREMRRE